mmetsp:Transcript_26621/g.61196  ORF Transcript_26621/g.61196 Transcript_26621/m.61196 type:complete len:97 (+) Transcript_26621:472-762(+)
MHEYTFDYRTPILVHGSTHHVFGKLLNDETSVLASAMLQHCMYDVMPKRVSNQFRDALHYLFKKLDHTLSSGKLLNEPAHNPTAKAMLTSVCRYAR